MVTWYRMVALGVEGSRKTEYILKVDRTLDVWEVSSVTSRFLV